VFFLGKKGKLRALFFHEGGGVHWWRRGGKSTLGPCLGRWTKWITRKKRGSVYLQRLKSSCKKDRAICHGSAGIYATSQERTKKKEKNVL